MALRGLLCLRDSKQHLQGNTHKTQPLHFLLTSPSKATIYPYLLRPMLLQLSTTYGIHNPVNRLTQSRPEGTAMGIWPGAQGHVLPDLTLLPQ